MIIQMNATVCAAEDHGDDRRRKAAGDDPPRRVQQGRGRPNGQEKQEIKGTRQKCCSFDLADFTKIVTGRRSECSNTGILPSATCPTCASNRWPISIAPYLWRNCGYFE